MGIHEYSQLIVLVDVNLCVVVVVVVVTPQPEAVSSGSVIDACCRAMPVCDRIRPVIDDPVVNVT